ncbi:MAG: hypothetical protein KR126chlam3_00633 [Chlamydiae bacterium]|nr:hypothetical protein [Chlamydiota bacterium]
MNSVSKEDRKDLQNLMNYFLFDHHVAFVLFGSKPMCEIILQPSKNAEEEKRLLASLPKEMREKAEIVKYPYSPYDCWKTWKKNQHHFCMQNFMFAERSLKIDPSAIVVVVVNIENTISVLREHYEYFKGLFGEDFEPAIEVLALKEINSSFWDCILSDHIAQGLLFGYGERNARAFARMIQKGEDFENFDFSTTKKIARCKATNRNFSIPQFRSFEDEKILKIYQEEQKKIERIYLKEDVLEVTLKKLTGTLPNHQEGE